ncbi:alpha/beta fold hydrolase [Dictyobacter kobayashii]|uniref:Lysophospholipase n=1 Tax=Dictyobacter kobayashii TaxID=2014872 RepID=A0A402AB15_9CHLR|nr:alpha/beta fold hydrolase [Dictyobacter kobayashii]GCE16236.1 lysophospholipase [Dictyobacter kobayashii]
MTHYNADIPGVWGVLKEDGTSQCKSEHITLKDNCQLFLRSWQRESTDVLLILHGLGGHGGWYVDMANELFMRGLSVYTVDHRGFGNSHGQPGHIDAYQQYVQDIAEIIVEIHKRHPDARVYILGHSMGGIFATHVAAAYGHLLNGVIFLNPWIRDRSQLSLRTTLSILIGGIFKSRRLWRVGGGHEGMTANSEAARMLEEDPYWVRDLTATFLVQILRMRLETLKKARSVTIPSLVLQAQGDKVVVIAAAQTFYNALKSTDKEWKTYPDWYHDTEFEADRALLDNDIVRWIEAHR